VIDGPTLVADALTAGVELQELFVTAEADHAVVERGRATGAAVHLIDAEVLRKAVDTVAPQAMAAVATRRATTIADAVAAARTDDSTTVLLAETTVDEIEQWLADAPADEVGRLGPEDLEGGRVERGERARPVGDQHGVREEVDRQVGHRSAARRWRNASNASTAPAMATLSDSERPAMGIVHRWVTTSSRSAGRPWASLPSTKALGRVRSSSS
jgi:hypothetical protein